MNDVPPEARWSPFAWILALGLAAVSLPFVLIGIEIVDNEFIGSGVPMKVYRAIGIWDPLGEFFELITGR